MGGGGAGLVGKRTAALWRYLNASRGSVHLEPLESFANARHKKSPVTIFIHLKEQKSQVCNSNSSLSSQTPICSFFSLTFSSLSIGRALTAGLNCEVRPVVPEATERVVIKDLYSSCLQISSNSSWSNGKELLAPPNIK